MRNYGMKLISLLVAILLSYLVSRESNSSVYTFAAPVMPRRDLPGKVITGLVGRSVQVTVRGPSFLVARLPLSPPSFRVELPPELPDRYTVVLHRADLDLPPYVEVLRIEPPEILVEVDELGEKSVPINIPKIGAPPEGFRFEGFTMSSEQMRVRGPRRVLDTIHGLETEPIDLRNLRESVRRTLVIRPVPEPASLEADRIELEVKITPQEVQRLISGVSLEVRAPPGGHYVVTPAQVAVRIEGRREAVDALTSAEVIPYVRVVGEVNNELRMEVRVELPAEVSLVGVEPASATVRRAGVKVR